MADIALNILNNSPPIWREIKHCRLTRCTRQEFESIEKELDIVLPIKKNQGEEHYSPSQSENIPFLSGFLGSSFLI